MPTLGTQNISDSFPQLLKTFGTGGLDSNLQIVTDGDNTSSALKLSTTGVNSSGSLSVDGATTLTGAVTFGTSITASTGTATLGTIQFNASGPKLTAVSYGTAAFTSATAPQYNAAQTTNGTFALTGAALGDIVAGTINSLGSATGTVNLTADFHVVSSGVARYVVNNGGNTAGTIPAGVIHATAMRFTA